MILQILKHTPAWVFVLFAGLVALGYWQTRTRTLSVPRVLVVPFAMAAFSIYGVLSGLGATAAVLAQWMVALLVAVGLFLVAGTGRSATYVPATRTFTVPGSWLPMVAILVIFFLRYAVNVGLALDAALRDSALFIGAAAVAYGASSGFFAARAIGIVRKARQPALA